MEKPPVTFAHVAHNRGLYVSEAFFVSGNTLIWLRGGVAVGLKYVAEHYARGAGLNLT